MPRRLKPRLYHSVLPLPPPLTPPAPNSLFSSATGAVEALGSVVEKLVADKEFSSFKVAFSWPKEGLSESDIAHLKRTVQYRLTKELGQKLGKKADFRSPGAEFLFDLNKNKAFLRLSPLYIEGNYCKFSREIANTSKPGFESVESLLNSILRPALRSQFGILHGAGREDVDVLMLGSGRPFILELLQPAIRTANLGKLEKEVNSKFEGKISVNSLKFVPKENVASLKNVQHEKIYSALVSCAQKPDLKKFELLLGKKIPVSQRTPLRVSKRRSDLVREKEVELLEIDVKKIEREKGIEDEKRVLSEKEFLLKLKTSHGTYVKEFISGDGGRTDPSVSSLLGCGCKCKQLDVLGII